MKLKIFLNLSFLVISLASLHALKLIAKENCPFCDEKILDDQKFYEDELVIALYTYKPIFPGHSLIIPKRHVQRFEELTDGEILRIGQVIKKVNCAAEEVFKTSSYLILQKNGKEVGQTVSHVHFHYIPRKMGDDSILKFMFKMYIEPLFGSISTDEMHENVEKMKIAMQNC